MPALPTVRVGNIHVPDVRGLFPDEPAYGKRELAAVDLIVIHHSATPGGETEEQEELRTIRAIYDHHQRTQGWPGVAYHCLVMPSGRTYLTGGVEDVRYHVADHNGRAYGLCLVGNFHYDPPPARQLEAAARFIAEMRYGLGAPLPLVGHRDLMSTECPGDTWQTWRSLLETALPELRDDSTDTARALLPAKAAALRAAFEDFMQAYEATLGR